MASETNVAGSGGEILLGTVAIEPNRWGMVRAGPAGTTVLSEWLDRIQDAGFSGLELWERHVTAVDAAEVRRIIDHPIPIVVHNTYASWDDPDPTFRDDAAVWTGRVGASGVKFNVGAEPSSEADYVDRLTAFDAKVPEGARLLCECHAGTLCETPEVAMRLFDEVAASPRLQAIVHLHRSPTSDLLNFMDVAADRVGHVHVQLSEQGPATDPAALADDLRAGVEVLRSFGFAGTWTLEFSHGLMTEHDEPAFVLRHAERDLRALRCALAS